MKKILLLLHLTAALMSVGASGQTVFKDCFDGEIYLKIKNETPYRFDTTNPDISIGDKLPFLNVLVAKYKIKRVEASFFFSKSEILQRTFRIHFDRRELVEKLIADLKEMKQTEYAEKIPIMRTDYTPNDLGTNDIAGQYGLYTIHAKEAWDVGRGNTGVRIAVVDGAVDIDHQDLAGNVFSSRDVSDNDNNPRPPNADSRWGHGTHTSGTACAKTNNGTGVASVSFNCGLIAIKATTDATTNYYLDHPSEGIVWAADNGAKVISCSFGGGGSTTLQNAVNYAYSKDAIVVASAGNNYNNVIQYPAGYNHVLSVAATDINDIKADFSCYGTWVKVSAPGVDILSTLPGNAYGYKSGTSMACPLVAGLCGLIRSVNPSLSYDDVVFAIINTADDIDAQNPGYIGQLGGGRINALRAVKFTLPCNGAIYLGTSAYTVAKTESSDVITSSNTIPNTAQVFLDAATRVDLQTGFHAFEGSVFHAYNDGCGGAKMSNPNIPAMAAKADIATDETNLTIYPNPSNTVFNIRYKLKTDADVKILLYSTDMKLVKQIEHRKQSTGTHTETVDASRLVAGIYFAKIERGNKVETRKVVVVH